MVTPASNIWGNSLVLFIWLNFLFIWLAGNCFRKVRIIENASFEVLYGFLSRDNVIVFLLEAIRNLQVPWYLMQSLSSSILCKSYLPINLKSSNIIFILFIHSANTCWVSTKNQELWIQKVTLPIPALTELNRTVCLFLFLCLNINSYPIVILPKYH